MVISTGTPAAAPPAAAVNSTGTRTGQVHLVGGVEAGRVVQRWPMPGASPAATRRPASSRRAGAPVTNADPSQLIRGEPHGRAGAASGRIAPGWLRGPARRRSRCRRPRPRPPVPSPWPRQPAGDGRPALRRGGRAAISAWSFRWRSARRRRRPGGRVVEAAPRPSRAFVRPAVDASAARSGSCPGPRPPSPARASIVLRPASEPLERRSGSFSPASTFTRAGVDLRHPGSRCPARCRPAIPASSSAIAASTCARVGRQRGTWWQGRQRCRRIGGKLGKELVEVVDLAWRVGHACPAPRPSSRAAPAHVVRGPASGTRPVEVAAPACRAGSFPGPPGARPGSRGSSAGHAAWRSASRWPSAHPRAFPRSLPPCRPTCRCCRWTTAGCAAATSAAELAQPKLGGQLGIVEGRDHVSSRHPVPSWRGMSRTPTTLTGPGMAGAADAAGEGAVVAGGVGTNPALRSTWTRPRAGTVTVTVSSRPCPRRPAGPTGRSRPKRPPGRSRPRPRPANWSDPHRGRLIADCRPPGWSPGRRRRCTPGTRCRAGLRGPRGAGRPG